MKRIVILVVAIGLLMAPSAAFAQSSTCEAYNPQTCESSSSGSTVTPTTTTTSTGTLPFTGLDVALLVAGGGALLGAGFVVRRLSRRPE